MIFLCPKNVSTARKDFYVVRCWMTLLTGIVSDTWALLNLLGYICKQNSTYHTGACLVIINIHKTSYSTLDYFIILSVTPLLNECANSKFSPQINFESNRDSWIEYQIALEYWSVLEYRVKELYKSKQNQSRRIIKTYYFSIWDY